MSAESPRKSIRHGGYIVPPQPVSDRSIIENVAGFINEVVPQSYGSVPQGESKEVITWARFEYGDINDPALYPDISDDHSETPPLLLVLGYGTGVQVWAIPASGESTEVLSWRQGVVRMLRILPTPTVTTTDSYSHKRPLIALCDGTGPGPQFCSLSFISLRTGDQVKNIKFKNPVSDVLANRRSVVVTFPERIAVFDASTLEDRLTVTTCYPCPGPNPNPVALGNRWLAYSERRLFPSRRSSGGTEGEGVQSYTATVLHVAKSFGKGLRELGETVATSLTGGVGGMTAQRGMTGAGSCVMAGPQGGPINCSNSDAVQAGIVTILDTQTTSPSSQREDQRSGDYSGPVSDVIAHFVAHSEPILALSFDPSGMLLLTADKRGHDFHLFRIQPHPGGPSLAAVHHLYTLHRGDTTAKVQDIAFAADSRWVAVSTMRGTTHVFPITPYGGTVGVRTHATPHVVNRLSRFHRSAGLTTDGRNSPIPYAASSGNYETVALSPAMPYPNPRLPPYPHPTVVLPLAQIRQPFSHSLLSTSASTSPNLVSQQPYHRNPSVRVLGRTQSSSDDGLPGGSVPLQMTTCFAPPRAWLVGSPTVPRDSSAKAHKRVVDSLFVMTCHGSLIEYDLEPKHASGVAKEKICDDTSIELEVHAKAQWLLLRQSTELPPPLPASNPLMALPDRLLPVTDTRQHSCDERWLSQVEIVTHAGPHRRLWMGPQFTFKTYTTSSGAPLSLLEMETVDVGVGHGSRPARSNPVNMPLSAGTRPIVPVLIESGSSSSYEQSPTLLEYKGDGGDSDGSTGPVESQLKEDLADAMMESPGITTRDTGRRVIVELRGELLTKRSSFPIEKVVNPLGTVITISMPFDDNESCHQTMHGVVYSPQHLKRTDQKILSTEENILEGGVRWPTDVKSSAVAVTGEKMNVELESDSSIQNLKGKLEIDKPFKTLETDLPQGASNKSKLTYSNITHRLESNVSVKEYIKTEGKVFRSLGNNSIDCDVHEASNEQNQTLSGFSHKNVFTDIFRSETRDQTPAKSKNEVSKGREKFKYNANRTSTTLDKIQSHARNSNIVSKENKPSKSPDRMIDKQSSSKLEDTKELQIKVQTEIESFTGELGKTTMLASSSIHKSRKNPKKEVSVSGSSRNIGGINKTISFVSEKLKDSSMSSSDLSGNNGELIMVNVNNLGLKLDFGQKETSLKLDSNSALTTVGLEQMPQEEKSDSEGNIDRCPISPKCEIGENEDIHTGSSRDTFENTGLERKKVVFYNDDDKLLKMKLKSKKNRFETFDAKPMYAECEHVEIQDPNLCTYPKLEGNITKSFKNTTKTKKIETKTNQIASKEVNKLVEKKAITNEITQLMFMSTVSPAESWSSTSAPWTKPVEAHHELESIKRHIQPSEFVKKCKIESIEEEHRKEIAQPFKEIENFAKSKSKSGKKTWSCVVSNNPVGEPLSMDRSRSLLEERCDVMKESFTLEKLDTKTTKNIKKVPFIKDSSDKLKIEAILESGKLCSSGEKVEVIAKRSWSNIVSSNVRKDSHCLIDVSNTIEAPESVLTPSQDACSDQVNFTDMQPPVNVPLDAFENAGAAAFNLEPETIVIATEEEEENNVIGGGDAFNSSSQSLAKKSKKSKKKKR